MYKLSAFADEAGVKLSEQIQAMQDNRISLLEIRGVDGKNIMSLSPDQVRETKKQLDDGGISVWSIGSPIGKIKLSDPFEPHLDNFKRLLETAHQLDARMFRLFSFYESYDRPEQVMAQMQAFCDAARGSNIALCLENEKGIYSDNAERMVEVLDAVPELHAVFDPANFVQCGVDTAKAWEMLCDRITYLHIKDALPDGTVVPAGYGAGNVAAIVKDYLARGGEVMTLEPHLTAFVGLKDLEAEQTSTVGSAAFRYADNRAAFDAAVAALRAIVD